MNIKTFIAGWYKYELAQWKATNFTLNYQVKNSQSNNKNSYL